MYTKHVPQPEVCATMKMQPIPKHNMSKHDPSIYRITSLLRHFSPSHGGGGGGVVCMAGAGLERRMTVTRER